MSKYKISKSPILKKYGLFDLNGNQILPFEYDAIFKNFDDKYFIVGNVDTFSINNCYNDTYISDFFKRYVYGLVDNCGKVIIKPFKEILWLKGKSVIATFDGVTNEINFVHQYLWHSNSGNIFLNDQIIYQSPEVAVVKVWCDYIPEKFRGDYKYIVYNTELIPIKEFLSLKEVEEKIIYKKTPWKDVINIFPGITFLVPKKWEAFHFTESECRDDNRWWGELEINGLQFSLIKEYHLINNHFIQIILKDDSVYIFNDHGEIIYHSTAQTSIQTMGYCLDRIVINGVYILNTNGTKYQIENHLQHMRQYKADGNGFIKVCDVPDVDMYINTHSMPYKYIGIMDTNGREIVPVIFPRPEYSDTYVEDHGNPYSNIADASDAFEGDPDAYWNID